MAKDANGKKSERVSAVVRETDPEDAAGLSPEEAIEAKVLQQILVLCEGDAASIDLTGQYPSEIEQFVGRSPSKAECDIALVAILVRRQECENSTKVGGDGE